MDLNPVKKLKIENSSASESSENVDGFNLGKKTIAKLNHDCLAKVLMHTSILDRLEMENVCEKWREVSELSWYGVKKLNLNDFMIRLDEKKEIFRKIMWRCCRYLRHLTMNDEHYLWIVDILKDNCRKMIYFDIDIGHGCEISNIEPVEIIESMSQLKYLKVSTFELENAKAISFIARLLQVLPEDIEEIHVIEKVSMDGFPEVLLNKFNNLHCLTLQGMSLTDATFESLMPSKNTLTHLDLSRCKFQSCGLQIFSNFKNLEQLILLYVSNLNCNVIRPIAHNCSKLKHFKFTKMQFEERSLPYDIFRELRYLNLEHLQCDTVVDNENIIFDFENNWKELKHLDVGKGARFSQLDLQEIMKFKKLEYLNLCLARVDSESFINITRNFPELKELPVYCQNISQTALENLTNLKKLEKWNFVYCKYLTGNSILKVANYCKNLVDVNLRSCKNLTEASLIQVGKLEYLKNLDVSGIENVPNEMFYNFRKLQYLLCMYCPSVTDEAIIKVIDNCKKLFLLNVRGTGITVESLVYAANREFVFTELRINVNNSVKDAYIKNNSAKLPYLRITTI